MQTARFGVPYQNRKWDAILQWEAFIADEVVHILPEMYETDRKSFWQHLWAPHSSHHVISAVADSQTAHKMPDLGHPFCTEKEMLYCNDRCTLLLNCSILFLWCIRWIRGASESIYTHGSYCTVSAETNSQIIEQNTRFGAPPHHSRHPLRLRYFISCLLLYTEGGMNLWQHL